MKEGAGEDPFAEDSAGTDANTDAGSDTESTTDGATPADSGVGAGDGDTDHGSANRSSIHIPYKFRRDSVQDGRDRVPLFLQSETKSGERDALRELEDRFDDDVSLTDLREALVKTGLDHMDEVEGHLESWGYGMTFEE